VVGPESVLVRSIVQAILREHPDAWVFKVHGSPYQMAGVPDLLVCIHGRLVAIEVKMPRPGESLAAALDRATPGQRHQIARIRKAGGSAGVVTSVTGVARLIEDALP